MGRTEIKDEQLTDFLKTDLLNFNLRWGRKYRRPTVGPIGDLGDLLRPTFAEASGLIRDHLKATEGLAYLHR